MAATEHEQEQGFGTGLRAQLERRQQGEESGEPTAAAAPPAETTPAPRVEMVMPDFGESDALRKELAESLGR